MLLGVDRFGLTTNNISSAAVGITHHLELLDGRSDPAVGHVLALGD